MIIFWASLSLHEVTGGGRLCCYLIALGKLDFVPLFWEHVNIQVILPNSGG